MHSSFEIGVENEDGGVSRSQATFPTKKCEKYKLDERCDFCLYQLTRTKNRLRQTGIGRCECGC